MGSGKFRPRWVFFTDLSNGKFLLISPLAARGSPDVFGESVRLTRRSHVELKGESVIRRVGVDKPKPWSGGRCAAKQRDHLSVV
jgi:hypothetical protein